MRKLHSKAAHGLGSEPVTKAIFSKNHYARSAVYPADIQDFIHKFDLHRVAGNVFEAPSTKDFWQVQGNKIMRLVGGEVDNGESIPAASDDNPSKSIAAFLDELEF